MAADRRPGVAAGADGVVASDVMSMTNEDHNAEWELGDAITIRLDPEEPDTEAAAETPTRTQLTTTPDQAWPAMAWGT